MTTQTNGNGAAPPAAPTFSEAPASATVKVTSPQGYEFMLTTRAGRMADLLSQVTTLESWLVDHNWRAAPTGKGPGKAQADAAPVEPSPTCDKCGQPMTRRTTKDGSRSFWSCSTKFGNGEWCKGKPVTPA